MKVKFVLIGSIYLQMDTKINHWVRSTAKPISANKGTVLISCPLARSTALVCTSTTWVALGGTLITCSTWVSAGICLRASSCLGAGATNSPCPCGRGRRNPCRSCSYADPLPYFLLLLTLCHVSPHC